MNTYVYDLAESIEDRWQEVILLIDCATIEEIKDIKLYDAQCRATTLLIVAHLEGFIKDVAKAIIHDVNRFSTFNDSPIALKRTFCKTYFDSKDENTKELEQKRLKLIELLNGLEPKFIVDPFLIDGVNGNNKNPSPGVLNKICTNFGIKNIFTLINTSKLDAAFSEVKSEVSELINNLKDHVLSNTHAYPYSIDLAVFNINTSSVGGACERSFWETFIDQLLKYRNDIAHGSTLINSLSVKELTEMYEKVKILEYALIMILCSKSVPVSE